MTVPVLVIGAGGHSKVLIEALLLTSTPIAGIIDVNPKLLGALILGVPVLGGDELVSGFANDAICLVNGVGSVGLPTRRQKLFEKFKRLGYKFAKVIHPTAVVASDTVVDEGGQIMAGAVIQPGCRIGSNAIINTRASIDHDCVIGDHCHIAPGVTLSGGVSVSTGVHIGTGATVIQNIRIGSVSLVGAGALVLKDVPPFTTVIGSPAKVVKQ